jgi:AcrR family transcriptional regulator
VSTRLESASAICARVRPVPAARPPSQSPRQEMLARLTAAARESFATVGVSQSRMDDIARRAEMSRAGMYRLITGRAELVELALMERSREFGTELEAITNPDVDDVPQALIDLIVRAINSSRADDEWSYLTEAVPRVRLNQIMTTGGSPVHEIMRRPMRPLLDRARALETLRTDISDDEIIEWIQGILFLLGPREDLDDASLSRMIRRFALPAIFR